MNDQPTPDMLARIALAQVVEPGNPKIGMQVTQRGACDVVSEMLAHLSNTRLPDLAAAEREVELAATIGVRLVFPDTLDWPTQLDDLGPSRPLLLWVRGGGQLRLGVVRSVSVVGARAASEYGLTLASRLSSDLARAGWSVVSGGAFGVDAAAHRGVVAVRDRGEGPVPGLTVAVLACGVDFGYPKANASLFEEIVKRGLLVSEVPLGTQPRRLRFLVRNRLIAALTRGTVVVEAAYRSGALGTLRYAEKLGRVVMGLPGPVDSYLSGGVHRELRAGALLVTSAAEIIEAVGELGADLAPEPTTPNRPRDQLGSLARVVLDLFPAREAIAQVDLDRAAGLIPGALAVVLAELEAASMIRPNGAGWELTARARA